jgi:hypothetical protein
MSKKTLFTLLAGLVAVSAYFLKTCTGTSVPGVPATTTAISKSEPVVITLYDTVFQTEYKTRTIVREVMVIGNSDTYLDSIGEDGTSYYTAVADEVLVRNDTVTVDNSPEAQVFVDSLQEEWGKARLEVLSVQGSVRGYNLDVQPNPCPPGATEAEVMARLFPDGKTRARDNYVGVAPGYSIRDERLGLTVLAGRRWLGAHATVDARGLQSFGLATFLRF